MDSGAPGGSGKSIDGSASPVSARSAAEDEEVLHSDILNTVMMSWEADERESLAKDLLRSRQERDVLKVS
ncbi:unnamed protein product [Cylicostephanus goldi]|uniref:Uncharacterized protein n=1 Tax=Cylicostephanus goldi TaxID=71465 RepID=A0A3P6T9S4_CYLGO|nr:unnamed protein product [Cylicostephanus goldi]